MKVLIPLYNYGLNMLVARRTYQRTRPRNFLKEFGGEGGGGTLSKSFGQSQYCHCVCMCHRIFHSILENRGCPSTSGAPTSEWVLTDVANNSQRGTSQRLREKMVKISQAAHNSGATAAASTTGKGQRVREAKGRAREAEGRVREAEGRVREVVARCGRREEEAERRVMEAEVRAMEAEGRGIQMMEGRVAEVEERARQAERRAEEAEGRVGEAEQRARDAEERARQAERANDVMERQWVVERREVHITEKVLGGGGWGEVKVAEFRGTKVSVLWYMFASTYRGEGMQGVWTSLPPFWYILLQLSLPPSAPGMYSLFSELLIPVLYYMQVAAKALYQAIRSDYYERLFIREINMAARVRHPNLVQFIGACMEGDMVILTELLPTSLRRELERGGYRMSPQQLLSISLDVIRVLNYLHQMQPDPIIHRDISSANVLLEPLAEQRWRAKVTDYGSVHFQQQLKTHNPGSPVYSAPEAAIPALQSPKMDIFSFGVLLIEMCAAQFPEVSARERLIRSIRDQEWVGLIRRCIQQDKDQRPSAAEITAELQQRMQE